MYVNGFWLGVLMTLVVEVVVFIIAVIIAGHTRDEEEPTEEEIAFAEAFEAFCQQYKGGKRFMTGQEEDDEDRS